MLLDTLLKVGSGGMDLFRCFWLCVFVCIYPVCIYPVCIYPVCMYVLQLDVRTHVYTQSN